MLVSAFVCCCCCFVLFCFVPLAKGKLREKTFNVADIRQMPTSFDSERAKVDSTLHLAPSAKAPCEMRCNTSACQQRTVVCVAGVLCTEYHTSFYPVALLPLTACLSNSNVYCSS